MQRKNIAKKKFANRKINFAVKKTVEHYFLTIIKWALKKKTKKLISFLKKNIVSIDVILPDKNHELHTPISFLASENARDSVMFLLKHGANINYAFIGAKKGKHIELTLELQKYGASTHCSEIGEYMNFESFSRDLNERSWLCHIFDILINNVNEVPGIPDISKYVIPIYNQFLSAAALGGYFQWLNKILDEMLLDDKRCNIFIYGYSEKIIEGAAAGGHYDLVDLLIDKISEIDTKNITHYLKIAMHSYANHGYLDSPDLIIKLLSRMKEPDRRQQFVELADARYKDLNKLSTILHKFRDQTIRQSPLLRDFSIESKYEHERMFMYSISHLRSLQFPLDRCYSYDMLYIRYLLSIIENQNYHNTSFTKKTKFRVSDLKPQIFPNMQILLNDKKKQLQFKREYKVPHDQTAWLSDEVHGLLTCLITTLPNELNVIILGYLLTMPITIIPKPVSYYFQKEKLFYDLINIKDSQFTKFISYIRDLFYWQAPKEREEMLFLTQLEKSMPSDENQFHELLIEGSKIFSGNKKRLIDYQLTFFKINTENHSYSNIAQKPQCEHFSKAGCK